MVTGGNLVKQAGCNWGSDGEKCSLATFLFYFNCKSIILIYILKGTIF